MDKQSQRSPARTVPFMVVCPTHVAFGSAQKSGVSRPRERERERQRETERERETDIQREREKEKERERH